ncbi:MAG: TetR family transcriptional regulator [Burkholderiales bacterium]
MAAPKARQQTRRRGDKRERTREALIGAAAVVIAERGLERASLEEITARAHMTRGAFYGNFRDKHDLFLAVAQHYWSPILPSQATASRTFGDRMRALGAAVAKAAPHRAAAAVGATSFVLYALQNKKMRAVVQRKNSELYAAAAATLRSALREEQLPLPAETLVRLIHVIMEGFFALHALTPDLVTEDVIVRAFEALAGGARVTRRSTAQSNRCPSAAACPNAECERVCR